MFRVERQTATCTTQRWEGANYSQPSLVATAVDLAQLLHLSLSACLSIPISIFFALVVSLRQNKLRYAVISEVGTRSNLSWQRTMMPARRFNVAALYRTRMQRRKCVNTSSTDEAFNASRHSAPQSPLPTLERSAHCCPFISLPAQPSKHLPSPL